MRFRTWISWQVVLLCLACFLGGGALALTGATMVYMESLGKAQQALARSVARSGLLEAIAMQQSSVTQALDQVDAPKSASSAASVAGVTVAQASASAAVVEKAAVPAVPAAPVVVASVQASTPALATPSRAASPTSTAQPKPKVTPAHASVVRPTPPPPDRQENAPVLTAKAAASPAPVLPAASAEGPVQAPTAQEIAAARGARIEGVPAEKAGVLRVSPEGVHLKNGTVVRPGGRFPSGERLLQVDPETNRVITNQRQLLLFFSPRSGALPD